MTQNNLEAIRIQLEKQGLTIVSKVELETLRKSFHGTNKIHKKI